MQGIEKPILLFGSIVYIVLLLVDDFSTSTRCNPDPNSKYHNTFHHGSKDVGGGDTFIISASQATAGLWFTTAFATLYPTAA